MSDSSNYKSTYIQLFPVHEDVAIHSHVKIHTTFSLTLSIISLLYWCSVSINVLIIRSNETLQPNTQVAPPKASPRYYSHSYMIITNTLTNILIVSTFFHYFGFSNNAKHFKYHSRLSKHYKMINVPNGRVECTN